MRAAVLVLLSLISACKLTEVTVGEGEQSIVVHSVLNPLRLSQFAIVEYSFNGDTTGRTGLSRNIPPGRPQFPMSGAFVTITYDAPASCAGRIDTLREGTGTSAGNGIYTTATTGCPIAGGTEARLTVVTPDGKVVTGSTTVPGISARTVTSGGRSARFNFDTLPLYRERDTVRADLSAVGASGLQLEVRRAENHADLTVYLFSDSLGVALPGTLVNPFAEGGVSAFRPGRYYLVTLGAADRNYYDFIRSVSDPVTGRGFINHLEGGIGVFGSVAADEYLVRVVGDRHDPREGIYRFTGRVGTTNLDFTVDLYLNEDPEVPQDDFSGLVDGVVQDGPVAVSGDGEFGFLPGVSNGQDPNAFQFAFQVIRTLPPRFRQYNVRGVRSTTGASFNVDLAITSQNGATVTRTTMVGQQTSPP